MKAQDFHRIIEAGESAKLEFKSAVSSPKVVARVVSAFLNAKGGQLIIGIGKDGQLLGVKDAKTLADRLSRQLAEFITPPALWHVEVLPIENKEFVVVEVAEGPDKPYVSNGTILIRRGECDVPANRDEITRLISDRSITGNRWERQVIMGADLEDLDLRLVTDSARTASESGRWTGNVTDPGEFLADHGLLESGRITNGAVVLFGKSPTRFLPQARVRVVEMPGGKTGDEYDFDQMFDSCILRLVDEIEPIITARIGGVSSRFVDDSWERKDRILYPPKAIREAILNAIIHRDYRMCGSILISILPSELRVTNPGGLPDGLKPADLRREHPSIPVNPDIAHIAYLRRLIDKVGRGTQKIIESCKERKLKPPQWATSQVETTLTLFAPAGAQQQPVAAQSLSLRQMAILKILSSHGPCSAPDLVAEISEEVTDRTIRSDLKKLVNSDLLEMSGQARSSIYHLTELGKSIGK
jgi:ATP-dependent DNA helicase RecG